MTVKPATTSRFSDLNAMLGRVLERLSAPQPHHQHPPTSTLLVLRGCPTKTDRIQLTVTCEPPQFMACGIGS